MWDNDFWIELDLLRFHPARDPNVARLLSLVFRNLLTTLFLLSSVLGHLPDIVLDTVDAPNRLPNEARRRVPNGAELNFKSDPHMLANQTNS